MELKVLVEKKVKKGYSANEIAGMLEEPVYVLCHHINTEWGREDCDMWNNFP